jgi:hypothetical protein
VNVIALIARGDWRRSAWFNSALPNTILTRRVVSEACAWGHRCASRDWTLVRLGTNGRLYDVGIASGVANTVGSATIPYGRGQVGFDFNPCDRIRIVTDAGVNLRAIPSLALRRRQRDLPGRQNDGPLAFASGDTNAGRTPTLVGAAYTNSTFGSRALGHDQLRPSTAPPARS